MTGHCNCATMLIDDSNKNEYMHHSVFGAIVQVGGVLLGKAEKAAFLLFHWCKLREVMTGHCNCAAMLIDDSNTAQMNTQCFDINDDSQQQHSSTNEYMHCTVVQHK